MKDYLLKILTVLSFVFSGFLQLNANSSYFETHYEYTDSLCNAEVKTYLSISDSAMFASFSCTYNDTIILADDVRFEVIYDVETLDTVNAKTWQGNYKNIWQDHKGVVHCEFNSTVLISGLGYKPDTLYNFTIKFRECEVVHSLRTPNFYFVDNNEEHSVNMDYGYTDSICDAEIDLNFHIRDSIIYADFGCTYKDTIPLSDDVKFDVVFDKKDFDEGIDKEGNIKAWSDNDGYHYESNITMTINGYTPESSYHCRRRYTIKFGECEEVHSPRFPAMEEIIGAIHDITAKATEPPFYVYDMKGILVKADSEKMPSVDDLKAGIYVVKSRNGAKKVLVCKQK